MKVFLKRVVIGIVFISPLIFATEHEHGEKKPPSEKAYFRGLEPFDPQGRYEVILQQTSDDQLQAKTKLAVLREQHGAGTVRSKSDSVKNEIYFRLANALPAGTIFRVVRAHDNNDGNIRADIETKDILDKESVSGDQILSIETAAPKMTLSAPKKIHVEPDVATLSLPSEWDKEKGFEALSNALASGSKTAKASIVFHNPDNEKKYGEHKPFASVINALMMDNWGHFYGIGFSDNQLAWWTQDITSSQLVSLYENDLVINLIPR